MFAFGSINSNPDTALWGGGYELSPLGSVKYVRGIYRPKQLASHL